MEAKKYRIDNYLQDKKGRICKVESLSTEEFNELKAPAIKGALTTLPNAPIELDINWLNNFGFDSSEYKKGYTGIQFRSNMILDFIITEPKVMGEWQDYYAFDLGQNRFVPMKYVHELQNLFFAVTGGKELELKDESSVCS